MEPYRNLDADSSVVAYEIGADFIRVRFSDGSIYLYTHASAGSRNIEHMKQLAQRCANDHDLYRCLEPRRAWRAKPGRWIVGRFMQPV